MSVSRLPWRDGELPCRVPARLLLCTAQEVSVGQIKSPLNFLNFKIFTRIKLCAANHCTRNFIKSDKMTKR